MHLDQHGSRSSRSHKSEDDSDDDSDLWDVLDEPVEVPVDAPAAQSTRKQTPPTVGAHPPKPVIMSETEFTAVKDIFMPSNAVKTRTGEVLLKQQHGAFRRYSGIDLDGESLEGAGHMPASLNQTHADQLHFAEKLSEVACRHRCGGAECCGNCRVGAFVETAGYGTDFFFGEYDEVIRAVTDSCACEVHIWDALQVDSMPQMKRMLRKRLLETAPGLAMQTTELKTVPGQVKDTDHPHLRAAT